MATFDYYGTLIDREGRATAFLCELARRYRQVLQASADHEWTDLWPLAGVASGS